MSRKLELIQGIINCTKLTNNEKEVIIQQYLLNWITDQAMQEKIQDYK